MKRVLSGISLVLIVVATANLISGRAQEVSAPPKTGNPAASNPLKVALLKWYPANQTTSFKVGNAPRSIVFDGANIWVTNENDDTVSKLRANDGANLGTISVGRTPYGMAFDGANIWVSNSNANTVTKIRASDDKDLGTFAVGQQPWGVAFDGADIWVANSVQSTVSKLRTSDGKTLGTFSLDGPRGLAFDGTYMWVSSFNSTVTRLKLDGKSAGTFKVGAQPNGMAFDAANIWVANSNAYTVTKLRASDGENLGDFPVNGNPYAVVFDGSHIWVAAAELDVLRISDGVIVYRFNPGVSPAVWRLMGQAYGQPVTEATLFLSCRRVHTASFQSQTGTYEEELWDEYQEASWYLRYLRFLLHLCFTPKRTSTWPRGGWLMLSSRTPRTRS